LPQGRLGENGELYGPDGEVTVDGKVMKLSEIQQNENLMKLLKPSDADSEYAPDLSFSVSCETPLVKPEQKIVYWGADGEKGEGAVAGVFLYYEHYEPDENLTGLDVRMDPDAEPEIPWGELSVGVAEGVNALLSPTVRKETGGDVVFSCDYGGEKFSVTWKYIAVEYNSHYKGFVSAGGKSWEIPELDSPYGSSVDPSEPEDIKCAFFDLDGDKKLELAVYDSGSNGSAALYRTDGTELAWLYTGEE
jgi:hypothetical protein